MIYQINPRTLDKVHRAYRQGKFTRVLRLISAVRSRMRRADNEEWRPPPGISRGVVKEFLNYLEGLSEKGLTP